MKQRLKIRMLDFWDGFNETDNYFYNLLKQYYNLEIAERPDFILYSVYGYEHLKYKCPRIFYTGENQIPDFNICDYAMGFQYLEFGDRYKRIPIYYLHKDDITRAQTKHNFTHTDLDRKEYFCNFIYSNSKANPHRDKVFQLLSEYKRVESGGKHLNNIGERVENKNEFQKKSKFTIAFENSSFPGYTTEKILHAFSAQTIPIYWGDPLISKQFNKDAFINCLDYNSFEEVVERIKEIDKDDEEYLRIMKEPVKIPDGEVEIWSYFDTIVNQDSNEVFRRDRQFWGHRYEKLLIRDKFPKKKNTVKKAWRSVKKKLHFFTHTNTF